MRKLLAIIGTLLVLSGCSFLQSLSSASSTTVSPSSVAAAQNSVYVLKSGYGVALVAMTAYGSLPDCIKSAAPVAGSAPLCRSLVAMQSMEKARLSVAAAITSAENEVESISPNSSILSAAVGSAQAAWSAFQTIMSTYGVSPSSIKGA